VADIFEETFQSCGYSNRCSKNSPLHWQMASAWACRGL